MPRLSVFGSVNVDHAFAVDAFPRPGETVGGDNAYARLAGGKGANQACAAARAGVEVEVHFWGRVGRDDDFSVAQLERAGVIAREVMRDDALPTGSACVLCERASGENMIVVCAGANDAARARFREGDESAVLALQGEVPVSANLDAVRMMRTVNPRCVVVLNYAPATEISLELIEEVDCVVVNESEARAISEAYEILDEPTRASDRPQRNRAIVYTMGAAGARLVMTRDLTFREAFVRDGDGNSQDEARVEAMRFGDDETVIDTVGAGDAFVGAFCAAMASDATCADALRLASAAGGLTCLSSGARADVSRARERALPIPCVLRGALKNENVERAPLRALLLDDAL